MTLCLGVDLGGSTARAAVVERESGRVVASAKESWTTRRLEEVVQGTALLVKGLTHAHSVPAGSSVCVGLPACRPGGRQRAQLGLEELDRPPGPP